MIRKRKAPFLFHLKLVKSIFLSVKIKLSVIIFLEFNALNPPIEFTYRNVYIQTFFIKNFTNLRFIWTLNFTFRD